MKRWRAWLGTLARWAWRRLGRRPSERTAPADEFPVPGAVIAVLRRLPAPKVILPGEAGAVLLAHHARLRSAAGHAILATAAARRGVVIHARVDAGTFPALFVAAAPVPGETQGAAAGGRLTSPGGG